MEHHDFILLLFSVVCKYDLARRIALNDSSLVAIVAATASTNLAKYMT